MKKLLALLAFSTVLAFGAQARAADIVEAPAVYDWTGFYIGGNIGYAFEGKGDEVGVASNLGGPTINFGELDVSGWTGGGQIGADWQMGQAVFGIVVDVSGADIEDDFDNHSNKKFPFLSTDGESEINWWGTVRGRLGWAFDNVLIYGTGGFAWADVDYKVFTENLDNGVNAHLQNEYTATGWTAGGGLAWGINERWTVGGELLYVNLGEEEVTGRTNNFADTGEVLRTHATPDFWTARFNVNFRF